MKLGVILPGGTGRPEVVRTVTQQAERLGYDSVWLADHVVIPRTFASKYPYSSDGKMPSDPGADRLDPLATLAHLAGVTSTIRLATGVYLLPMRNPIVTARVVATVDVLSGGRFIFGVGIGWLKEEFDVLGEDFAQRAERTKEYVGILKTLWTQEQPTFEGKFFQFRDLPFAPKPVQKPHPPLVFGGHSKPALRRTAELGDGWFGVGQTPEEVQVQLGFIREHAARVGRSLPANFEVTIAPPAAVTLTKETVAQYAEAGVHRLITWSSADIERTTRHLTELAEQVS